MADEEENESYNYLYDQDNPDADGQLEEEKQGETADHPGGKGSDLMQQDMPSNMEGQEAALGVHPQGDPTIITGNVPHHRKEKYQKIPPEKYAHITHHSPRLNIILNILET